MSIISGSQYVSLSFFRSLMAMLNRTPSKWRCLRKSYLLHLFIPLRSFETFLGESAGTIPAGDFPPQVR